MKSTCIIFIIYAILLSSSCSSQEVIKSKNVNKSDFILIANTGISNYSVAPLIISKDSIIKTPSEGSSFKLKLKYKGFKNIVLSKKNYNNLFCFLHVHDTTFNIHDSNIFTIEYRNLNDKNYTLISSNEVSLVLFTLKSLYYFIETNDYPVELKNYINGMYNFYTKTYDYSNTKFKKLDFCIDGN